MNKTIIHLREKDSQIVFEYEIPEELTNVFLQVLRQVYALHATKTLDSIFYISDSRFDR